MSIVNNGYLYNRKKLKHLKVKPITTITMAKKNNFRMRVMKYAWQLWKSTGQAWRLCMIKAWQLYRLAKAMREGQVSFYYQKTDGTIRKAVGTLINTPSGATLGGKRLTKPSYKTISYFDIEKNAYRCFKIENLICMK